MEGDMSNCLGNHEMRNLQYADGSGWREITPYEFEKLQHALGVSEFFYQPYQVRDDERSPLMTGHRFDVHDSNGKIYHLIPACDHDAEAVKLHLGITQRFCEAK